MQPLLSVRTFFEATYRPLRLTAKSRRTATDYSSQLRVFETFWEERLAQQGAALRPLLLSDLTDELLAEARAWQLQRGRSIPTANHLYRVMRAIWRFAKRKGKIHTLPDLDPLPEHKIEPRTWTLDDYQKILAQADALRGEVCGIAAHQFWRALVLVIVNTGGRITAVMRTRVADVDLDRTEILLRSVNQKQRADQRFELQPAVLQAILATEPASRHWLFPWPYDSGNEGEHWQTLRRHYKRMLKRAGLPCGAKDLFHNLRRFTATVVADAEGEEFARDYLGHSHISVTRRYLDRSQMRNKRSAVRHLPSPDDRPQLRIVRPDAEAG